MESQRKQQPNVHASCSVVNTSKQKGETEYLLKQNVMQPLFHTFDEIEMFSFSIILRPIHGTVLYCSDLKKHIML